MTKLINLDDLAAATRSVVYKGVTHEVLDLSLEEFNLFQIDFDELIVKQAANEVQGMLSAARLIVTRTVPTFPDVKLLNLRQLMALVQLVSDFYPQVAESATAGNELSPAPTP